MSHIVSLIFSIHPRASQLIHHDAHDGCRVRESVPLLQRVAVCRGKIPSHAHPPSFQGSCNENGVDHTLFHESPPQVNYCKCALELSGPGSSSPNLAGNKFQHTVYVDNLATVPHSVRSLADGRRMLWGGKTKGDSTKRKGEEIGKREGALVRERTNMSHVRQQERERERER